MEKLRCKCVKGLDGFTWGEVYDVEFAGRVWWAVNDDGKRVSGASESFDPIEEPVSDDLEKAAKNYALNNTPWDDCKDEIQESFKAGAKWKEEELMAKAIDARCFGFQGDALFSFKLPAGSYLVGSKVKVIIIKED